uniref:Putative 3-hydroxybutyryl-CoA dehydrogenase n=1 Tax=mine drainage metagenome TaxID=410659 RepID=E6QKQ5_9ZZZZ
MGELSSVAIGSSAELPQTITVAIIGAGPLGRRLALRSAQAGYRVVLEDVMPANLRHAEETLRNTLGDALRGPNSQSLVTFARTLEEAVREADLVIDCVPDELESKLEIFSLLDRMAPPRTVFATPTRHLSIADLASCTYRPDRCVSMAVDAGQFDEGSGGEFLPLSNRCIPVCITGKTSAEARELVTGFWIRLGYEPVVEADTAEALLL